MPLCACGHEAALHPMIASYRSRCHAASGCHCKRYQQLTFRCFRCSNFALEGYRHCRQCMKELAAAGKGPTTHYPCAWCGTWEASKGDDLCPPCQEADQDSPTTPPQYRPLSAREVLLCQCGHPWGQHGPGERQGTTGGCLVLDKGSGMTRQCFCTKYHPADVVEKEEPTMPKITTTTTTSIASRDGFTIGDLQSFLDRVPRPQGLNTPVTVSLSPISDLGNSGGTVVLSVTTEDDR